MQYGPKEPHVVSTPHQVLVVGGGAAGVVTAAALLRGTAAVDVTLVERSEVAGPGLAYATTDPHHLLNNYAARMSAVEQDPEHLVRWCRSQGIPATGSTFLSRETYGRYLADLLVTTPVPAGSSLTRVHDEVVDLTDAGSAYLATLASESVLAADTVVLALGNPPPRRPAGLDVDDRRLVVDPWAPGLVDRVGEHDRVLLVGTGLTTVDVAAQLASRRPGVRLTATSRHGLLPLRHVPEPPAPAPALGGAFGDDGASLRDLLAEVRRRLSRAADGADWRCLVESVKADANRLWASLGPADRERFLRHVSRRWEIARHRMAPAMAEVVDDLLATGRLTIRTGAVDASSYDLVVCCTGPAPVSSRGWNPLVDRLLLSGVLRPGPLGLGVDVDADGALVDAHGQVARGVHAVGAARRGAEWEVAAVPDLRRQAEALVRHLAARVPAPEMVG
jgi:uncharacterized NAD(P)/FAD-binding protein YdhS